MDMNLGQIGNNQLPRGYTTEFIQFNDEKSDNNNKGNNDNKKQKEGKQKQKYVRDVSQIKEVKQDNLTDIKLKQGNIILENYSVSEMTIYSDINRQNEVFVITVTSPKQDLIDFIDQQYVTQKQTIEINLKSGKDLKYEVTLVKNDLKIIDDENDRQKSIMYFTEQVWNNMLNNYDSFTMSNVPISSIINYLQQKYGISSYSIEQTRGNLNILKYGMNEIEFINYLTSIQKSQRNERYGQPYVFYISNKMLFFHSLLYKFDMKDSKKIDISDKQDKYTNKVKFVSYKNNQYKNIIKNNYSGKLYNWDDGIYEEVQINQNSIDTLKYSGNRVTTNTYYNKNPEKIYSQFIRVSDLDNKDYLVNVLKMNVLNSLMDSEEMILNIEGNLDYTIYDKIMVKFDGRPFLNGQWMVQKIEHRFMKVQPYFRTQLTLIRNSYFSKYSIGQIDNVDISLIDSESIGMK